MCGKWPAAEKMGNPGWDWDWRSAANGGQSAVLALAVSYRGATTTTSEGGKCLHKLCQMSSPEMLVINFLCPMCVLLGVGHI